MGPSQSQSTISWGTDGIYTLIVKSIRIFDDNEIIYVEQGSGLRAHRIQLLQGRTVEFTCIDDEDVASSPEPEESVVFWDPIAMESVTFSCTHREKTGERKQPMDRVIHAVYDTLIEGEGTPL